MDREGQDRPRGRGRARLSGEGFAMEVGARLNAIDLPLARRLLQDSLFDAAFYRGEAKLGANEDGFAHYYTHGFRAGLRPNPVFDPAFYVEANPDAASVVPLLHYAVLGEPAGRDPSALFDVAWYRLTYGAERPLAHYLAHRFGPYSPIPEFDAAYYLKTYPDVGAARLDPFLHYMHFGFREFRKPFAGFNPRLYALRHLAGDRGANPVAHMRATGAAPAAAPSPPSAFDAVRRFARPGAAFERLAPAPEAAPLARVLAFHLTQFHRIPENDAWWGEGFTEWTHMARGQPRFAGHYQPRIPGRLGFYDLADPAVLRAQGVLARNAGIAGFVFYTYDFDGRRLLEKPLEAFLAAPDIDIGFCLMWANENWTRRWDGAESEVLIAQTYDPADEPRRCAEFARHFRDPRYVRLGGRPLLMVYRGGLIPDARQALARWRRLFAQRHGEEPIFVMAQTFDDVDPRPLGFDAAVEFPPHKLTRGLPQVYDSLDIFDESFEADAFAYADLVEASLAEPAPDFPLIKTAVPSWDNDARRQGQGLTLVGSTPRQYERWLGELVAGAAPFFGERLVCVNAWNEWSEGAYLEPDVHFGAAYLNATARAVRGVVPPKARLAVLGGSPRLAALARRLAAEFGLAVALDDAVGAEAALTDSAADVAARTQAGLRVAYAPDAAPDLDALRRAAATVLASAFADAGRTEADAAKCLADLAPADGADPLARALFARLWPATPKISVVVVPSFAPDLAAALACVFAQTHPVWEVIVIAADEAALDAVDAAARAADREASLLLDPTAAPWRRAGELASGDCVWIVPADALCDPTCLARLAAPLGADARLALSFCDSRPVDRQGRPLHAAPTPLDMARRSLFDRTLSGADLAALAPPRPAAVLWRRDALASGDDFDALWRGFAAAPDVRARHVAEALNFVRRP